MRRESGKRPLGSFHQKYCTVSVCLPPSLKVNLQPPLHPPPSGVSNPIPHKAFTNHKVYYTPPAPSFLESSSSFEIGGARREKEKKGRVFVYERLSMAFGKEGYVCVSSQVEEGKSSVHPPPKPPQES